MTQLLSFTNNHRLKFQTAPELPIIVHESSMQQYIYHLTWMNEWMAAAKPQDDDVNMYVSSHLHLELSLPYYLHALAKILLYSPLILTAVCNSKYQSGIISVRCKVKSCNELSQPGRVFNFGCVTKINTMYVYTAEWVAQMDEQCTDLHFHSFNIYRNTLTTTTFPTWCHFTAQNCHAYTHPLYCI